MEGMPLLDELAARGLVADVTDRAGLAELLGKHAPVSAYAGYDPTSPSLHVGNLVPTILLRRLQLAGHRPIIVVGGATGMIGDPSGKSEERNLLDDATLAANVAGIRSQLARLLDMDGVLLVNNADWTRGIGYLEFLRDIGKHLTVSYMTAKDSVKARLEGASGSGGISYTEFSYMLLQAFDFVHLAKAHGCRLQVGGSDQYGNITAGMDLIRRVDGKSAAGMTFPLVTNAAGEKFGKSMDNSVWLDPARTSPYAFYQFWINTEDRDAVPYLKLFTFLDRGRISELEASLEAHPERREAQRALATEMTTMLHGADECAHAVAVTEALFGSGPLASVDPAHLEIALESAPTVRIDGAASPPEYAELLVQAGLAKSISEAVRLVDGGGVSANDLRVGDARTRPSAGDFLGGRLLVLRRGKRSHALIVRG
jgi:tyrosyl-tRNA synthetase